MQLLILGALTLARFRAGLDDGAEADRGQPARGRR